MAGRGPAPKDASVRKRNAANMRVIEVTATPQPELPTRFKTVDDEDGTHTDILDWPEATVRWWNMWAMSPLSIGFTDADWSELEMCALLHAEFMEGNYKYAAELRLRTAKFGTTPEDRARLKITFAMADDATERVERRRASKQPSAATDPRLKLVQ